MVHPMQLGHRVWLLGAVQHLWGLKANTAVKSALQTDAYIITKDVTQKVQHMLRYKLQGKCAVWFVTTQAG